MITDLRDLERLLGQYERGLILAGPVLGFSSDDYRYFYVAASGGKIYEAIGLGVFDNEADAENQRANIIAILKNCFGEMLIFGNHLEMARAAEARWPNEETAKVLALASLLTEHEPDAIVPDTNSDNNSQAHETLGDDGQPSIGDVAPEEVNLASEALPPDVLRLHDETKPSQSPSPQNVSLGAPSPSANDGRPATTSRPVHSGRSDDISAISRAPRPPYHQGAAKSPAAPTIAAVSGDRVVQEGQGRFERKGDLLAIMASFTRPNLSQAELAEISRAIDPPDRPRSIPWFSLENARGLVFLIALMFVVGGATALLTWAMFHPSTPRMEHDAGTITAPQLADASAPSSIPSQQTVSIKPPQIGAEQPTEVNKSIPRNEPAPKAVAPLPPTPQSSGGISPQANIRADSGSARQPMTNAQQVEPTPTAAVPLPPAPQSSGGTSPQAKIRSDIGPAQQPMTNAQQVEPAPTVVTPSAAAPQPSGGASVQVRTQSESLSEQRATTGVPPRQVEPTPTAVAPSPPPSPSESVIARAEAVPKASPERQARTASGSGSQPTPAQGPNTALRPQSQEITALIERGTDLLKRGDIASARLFLRRAAEAGSADAALKLGSTFDPTFIRQLGAIGVAPDVARARQWYEKAAELGSEAAAQRLAGLKNQ